MFRRKLKMRFDHWGADTNKRSRVETEGAIRMFNKLYIFSACIFSLNPRVTDDHSTQSS